MIKKIKAFIEDFMEFRRIRRLNRTVELGGVHKNIIRAYNKDYEKEINALVLVKLGEDMISTEISPEYYRGFRSALTYRISYLGLSNHVFPINKNDN